MLPFIGEGGAGTGMDCLRLASAQPLAIGPSMVVPGALPGHVPLLLLFLAVAVGVSAWRYVSDSAAGGALPTAVSHLPMHL